MSMFDIIWINGDWFYTAGYFNFGIGGNAT